MTPYIEGNNLSVVWGKAFRALMRPGQDELTPLTVRIHGFRDMPDENAEIRARLDEALASHTEPSCKTVASTIFPESMWNPNIREDSEILYRRYLKAWSGIKKCSNNRFGVYFHRLIAYQTKTTPEPVNQLQTIVDVYRKDCHRRNALQAGIFDPTRDFSASKQRGFPCLQQVGFIPNAHELGVVAFYPMQYHFEKSYGNYLGLCHLGRFMAKQMGLTFTSLTCMAAVLKRGDPPKYRLTQLDQQISAVLEKVR